MPKKTKADEEHFIQIKGDALPLTPTRQLNSKGLFMCPACLKRWYFPQPLLDFFADIEREKIVDGAFPRCTPCNVIAKIMTLPDNLPPPVTVEDLRHIHVRAQDASGKWGSVSLHDATNEQFEEWITSKMRITGDVHPWTLEERAAVCDVLLQFNALYSSKKEEGTQAS